VLSLKHDLLHQFVQTANLHRQLHYAQNSHKHQSKRKISLQPIKDKMVAHQGIQLISQTLPPTTSDIE